jgi:hypothetical protein
MAKPLDYAPRRGRRKALLLTLRLLLAGLIATCSWGACWILHHGPSGSGSAMVAAVRIMTWAVGLAVLFFACLLLTFCTWRRGPGK